MYKSEIRQLFDDIRENRKKIDSCDRHCFDCFDVSFTSTITTRDKRKCSNCGGEMTVSDILTYCRGYEAAGGNPNDVMEVYSALTKSPQKEMSPKPPESMQSNLSNLTRRIV